jgi:hypothetical protein
VNISYRRDSCARLESVVLYPLARALPVVTARRNGKLISALLCAVVCSGAWVARAEEDVMLVRMLREGQNPNVRAGAANLMGRRHDLEHRPELEGALQDQHPVVRAAAASALGRLGSRSSLPPLQGVASHDRVPSVATEARAAIRTIEVSTVSSAVAAAREHEDSKKRFGLLLGQMRNQSDYRSLELNETLGGAVEKNVGSLPGVAVFRRAQLSAAETAQQSGLAVFRLDGTVTSLSAELHDGQLLMHCEVSLLVMDQPNGSLRTLLRGAARAAEIANATPELQQPEIARRVVDAAVRSALRHADAAILDAAQAKPRGNQLARLGAPSAAK